MNKIEQAIATILSTSLSDNQKQQALLLVCSTEQPATKQPQFKPTKNPPQDTFVYLIENEQGHIKIGFSGNPEKRLSQLKTACPSAKLIHKFSGTMQDEKHLQSLFAALNIDKEWFRLGGADIEEIKQFFESKKLARYSEALEYEAIKTAILDGSYFDFEDVVGTNAIRRYTKMTSPSGKGAGQAKAIRFVKYAENDRLPMTKTEFAK